MLLALNIGNTHLAAAMIKGETLIKKDEIMTKSVKDEGVLRNFLLHFGENYSVNSAVVASVVGELGDAPIDIIKELFGVKTLTVNAFLDLGYEVPESRKKSVGADILATNAAAYALYGNALVVDTGTATTFQVVADGRFRGCVIASGLYMGLQALYDFTSLLPNISLLQKPAKVMGTNTVECMQSGAIFGHAGMIDGIVKRIKAEVGAGLSLTVVGTGGAANMINGVLETPFDIIDNDLTFKGLKIIYDRNT